MSASRLPPLPGLSRRSTLPLLFVVALLIGALATASASADAKVLRCCFQVSVQAGGVQNVDYGDGNDPSYPFFRGRYVVHWQFAFRELMKLDRLGNGGSKTDEDMVQMFSPDALKDDSYLVNSSSYWIYQDTPENVEAACCFEQNPHGWEPACAKPNADLGVNGFQAYPDRHPDASLGAQHLFVRFLRPRDRANFICGLNDGRLDGVIPGPFDTLGLLSRPSERKLRHGRDFAQSCSMSAEMGPDGGLSVVGSSASVQVRARFVHFAPRQLPKYVRRLHGLAGSTPPGFQGPASTPNDGPRCRAG